MEAEISIISWYKMILINVSLFPSQTNRIWRIKHRKENTRLKPTTWVISAEATHMNTTAPINPKPVLYFQAILPRNAKPTTKYSTGWKINPKSELGNLEFAIKSSSLEKLWALERIWDPWEIVGRHWHVNCSCLLKSKVTTILHLTVVGFSADIFLVSAPG